MDLHWVVETLLGIVIAGVAWFANVLWGELSKIKEKHGDLEVRLAQNYVPNNRFDTVLKEINDNIRHILEKLDGKAERRESAR